MAETVYKAKKPFKQDGKHYYPITTHDQIIMPDGNRWDGQHLSSDVRDEATEVGSIKVNADLLGGKLPEYYKNATTLGGIAASGYALKTDTALDSAKLGGKAPEYYIQARNLLDNSNFLNPINQRGKTVYESGFGLTIDRWYLGHSAVSSGGKASLTIHKGGISIRNTTGEAQSYAYIQTRVAKEEVAEGKTYTFAYKRNGEIVLLTLSSEHIANDIEVYGFLPLSIENKNINEANIEWAALYEGIYTAETLPPYTPKGYAVEMAECKRYYEKLSPNAMLKTTVHADFYELLVQYVEKRIDNPTVTYVGNNIAGIDNIGKSSCRFYSYVMSDNYVSTVEITADL